MAFESAKSLRQLSQSGSMITMDKTKARSVTNQYPSIKPLFEYVDKIAQELEVLKLGIEYNHWKGYRHELNDLNPNNTLYNSQHPNQFDETRFPLFRESTQDIENWVRRNFSFVVETILMWEDSWDRAGKFVKDLEVVTDALSNFLNLDKT